MGRRGPLTKANRQGHGPVARLEVFEGGRLEPPPPPPRLLRATAEEWATFWSSDEALAITEAGVPVVVRLFELRDERRRLMNLTRRGELPRFTEGSTGQPRLAPSYDLVLKLEAAIGRLETELGLTPMARARLGLTVGQTQLTLDQLNARALEPDPAEPDPRLDALDVHPKENPS